MVYFFSERKKTSGFMQYCACAICKRLKRDSTRTRCPTTTSMTAADYYSYEKTNKNKNMISFSPHFHERFFFVLLHKVLAFSIFERILLHTYAMQCNATFLVCSLIFREESENKISYDSMIRIM